MKKIAITALLIVCASGFFVFGGAEYLTLDALKNGQETFDSYYSANPALTIAGFMLMYIFITALSLPGAAVMTLAAGALFGLFTGTVVVSIASTIGATLAFFVARYVLGESVQKKYKARLTRINQGIEKDGVSYLLFLRLVPVFPFFLVNILMGLTKMNVGKYFVISQLGMLPGTIVYVFAGTALADIESLSDIVSTKMLLAFALLGSFPIIVTRLLDVMKSQRVYGGYKRPKSYDYNLVAIGGGAAGLVSTYIGAAVNAKVALIEKHKMGGDCLNTGCVPSKALIKTAKVMHITKNHDKYGIKSAKATIDFKQVMARVHDVIKKIEPHDSVERYTSLGVDVIEAEAKIIDPWTIQVGDRKITTRNIVVATGASPFIPPIKGLETAPFYTSETLWSLDKLPEKLIVLGGGPIGSEMTQAFARLGASVTQVEMTDYIMGREDVDVSEYMKSRFEGEGIKVLTGYKASEFFVKNNKYYMIVEKRDGDKIEIEFDAVIVAVGRKARVNGFGLEDIGVELSDGGAIASDDFLRTNFPNVFVAGDVAGSYQFTHTAAHQAWYAAVNALFGKFKKFAVDYSVIPWTTYTDPEVARVGLNEAEAVDQGIEFDVVKYHLNDLDRAITESETEGWVKVLTPPKSDKILGVTIVGSHAGDILAEFVLAMKHGLGLNKILGTIHTYPTFAEANKYAAGEWKKANKPEWLLKLLKSYHDYRRRG